MDVPEKSPPFSIYFALFSGLFAIVANFTIVVMASPYITSDLGGSNDITIYLLAFFGLGSALGIPLAKPIGAQIGSVPALVLFLLLFTLCTWFCAIAPNTPLMNAARFFQGFAGGPFFPLFNHIITHITPPKKMNRKLAILVTILTIGPVFSACWGGFIAYEFFWRWSFSFSIPFLLLLALFLWQKLRHLRCFPEKRPFDWTGYLFYFFGIFPLSFAAITAQELDWYRSPLLVACVLIGAPCFLFFILWTWRSDSPILELHFFKRFSFSLGIFYLGALFAIYFGTITLLPLWLTLYAAYTPIWIGLLIGAMALSGLIPPLLVGEKLERFDPRYCLAIAIILLAFSCFHTTLFSVDINFGRIAFSRVAAGFGLAFLLPPLFHLCFKSFPTSRSLDVIALFQVVRNLSGGVGAALCNILWQRRQVFFHARLGEQLNHFSQPTRTFFHKTAQYLVPGDPNAQLDFYLERQARALGLDDTFYLFGYLLLALLLLLLLTFPLNISSAPQEHQQEDRTRNHP